MASILASPSALDDTAEEHAQIKLQGPMAIPLRTLLDAMKTAVPLSEAIGILDVGCGPGTSTAFLIDEYGSQISRDAQLLATDFSHGMIDELNKKKEELSVSGDKWWKELETQVCDAQTLEGIPDGSMSHIMGNMVYFMLPEPRNGLEAAYRVLRTGGVLGFTSWIKVEWMEVAEQAARIVRPNAQIDAGVSFGNWSTPEGIRRDMEAAGFRDVDLQVVDIDIPQRMQGLDAKLLRWKNPGVQGLVQGASGEEIGHMCEEYTKLVVKRSGLKGVIVVAVGKK